MKTVLFNPFTGQPRNPDAVAADPSGLLLATGHDESPPVNSSDELAKIQLYLDKCRAKVEHHFDDKNENAKFDLGVLINAVAWMEITKKGDRG